MDLSPYVSALRENLTAAAAAGDEQTRNTARALAATLEPATRLAMMNALSDLAAEVTVALEDRVVDVRLNGQDVQVVVTGGVADEPEEEQPEQPPPSFNFGDNGDISRITVRLFEELKAKAEQAAAAQGVSLNSFVSQAVQGALMSNLGQAGRGGGRGGWPGGGGFGGGQWNRAAWEEAGRQWAAQAGGGNPGSGNQSGNQGGNQSGNQGEPKRGGRNSSRVRGWVEG